MANQLAEPPNKKLRAFVESKKADIFDAIPNGVNGQLIVRSFLGSVEADANLLKCTPASLVDCLRKSAIYGLEVGTGITAQAYMIPYGTIAQFQIGYKGVKELVRRSGKGDVVMESVVEGDTFENLGRNQLPKHVPSKSKTRRFDKVTHVYAAYVPYQGLPQVSVWTREECIAHRDKYAKGYKSKDSPWHEDNPGFRVMCMKTAVMELANRQDMPLSTEVVGIMREEVAPAMVARTPSIQQQLEQADDDVAQPPVVLDEDTIRTTIERCGTITQIQDAMADLAAMADASCHELIREIAEEYKSILRSEVES